MKSKDKEQIKVISKIKTNVIICSKVWDEAIIRLHIQFISVYLFDVKKSFFFLLLLANAWLKIHDVTVKWKNISISTLPWDVSSNWKHFRLDGNKMFHDTDCGAFIKEELNFSYHLISIDVNYSFILIIVCHLIFAVPSFVFMSTQIKPENIAKQRDVSIFSWLWIQVKLFNNQENLRFLCFLAEEIQKAEKKKRKETSAFVDLITSSNNGTKRQTKTKYTKKTKGKTHKRRCRNTELDFEWKIHCEIKTKHISYHNHHWNHSVSVAALTQAAWIVIQHSTSLVISSLSPSHFLRFCFFVFFCEFSIFPWLHFALCMDEMVKIKPVCGLLLHISFRMSFSSFKCNFSCHLLPKNKKNGKNGAASWLWNSRWKFDTRAETFKWTLKA